MKKEMSKDDWWLVAKNGLIFLVFIVCVLVYLFVAVLPKKASIKKENTKTESMQLVPRSRSG